jgi:hypothetical protein
LLILRTRNYVTTSKNLIFSSIWKSKDWDLGKCLIR